MNTILKFVGNKMMLKKLTLQLVETSYKGKIQKTKGNRIAEKRSTHMYLRRRNVKRTQNICPKSSVIKNSEG